MASKSRRMAVVSTLVAALIAVGAGPAAAAPAAVKIAHAGKAAPSSLLKAESTKKIPFAIQSAINPNMYETVDVGFGPIVLCIPCVGPLVAFPKDLLDIELQKRLHANVLAGMQNLGYAHTTDKPEESRRYQDAALTYFRTAAGSAGKASVKYSAAGYYDPEKNKTIPAENRQLVDLARHLTDGLTVLQQAGADESPELAAKAMELLDAAYADFAEAAVIGNQSTK